MSFRYIKIHSSWVGWAMVVVVQHTVAESYRRLVKNGAQTHTPPYLMLPIKGNEHSAHTLSYCYFFKIGSIPKEKNTIKIKNNFY